MTEEARQSFADSVRARGLDWSFRWFGDQKVFTDLKVQKEWQNYLKESQPC